MSVVNGSDSKPTGEDVPKTGESKEILHPLQRKWTLWFDCVQYKKRVKNGNWLDMLDNVHTFGTVEDFWRLFNNIHPPSCLDVRSNYHVFVEGVEPMWEHEANKNGGRWLFELPYNNSSTLDEYWLNTVLSLIGETLDGGDVVTGVVCSLRRPNNRIAIWTSSCETEPTVRVAKALKKALGFKQKMNFTAHDGRILAGTAIIDDEVLHEI